MQHPMRRGLTGALAATLLAGALTLAGAVPAQAATQNMFERGCVFREVIVASQTTGQTSHGADGKRWDKGVKANAGATTYTGQQYVVHANVTASVTIHSAGTRCS